MKRKALQRVEFVEYLTIGLAIGLILSYAFKLSLINGICIGLSFGLLLQKVIQEKKIVLAIYILTGLLVGCVVSTILNFSYTVSLFSFSVGMLLGTVAYLINPNAEKKMDLKKHSIALAWLVLIGIIVGGVIGFICYKLTGVCVGIGIGMILGILVYLKM